MEMDHEILRKRVYAPWEAGDGWRVLVDRMWPRGIRKEAARLDEWAKEIAPGTELRRRYHGGGMTFEGFSRAYREELDANQAAEGFVRNCRDRLREQNVTLVYAAKNEQENHALVLGEWLQSRLEAAEKG